MSPRPRWKAFKVSHTFLFFQRFQHTIKLVMNFFVPLLSLPLFHRRTNELIHLVDKLREIPRGGIFLISWNFICLAKLKSKRKKLREDEYPCYWWEKIKYLTFIKTRLNYNTKKTQHTISDWVGIKWDKKLFKLRQKWARRQKGKIK